MCEFRSILVLATTFRSSHTHKRINKLQYWQPTESNFQFSVPSSFLIYLPLTQSINQFFNLNSLSNNLPHNTTQFLFFVLFTLYEYFWKNLIFWSCFLLSFLISLWFMNGFFSDKLIKKKPIGSEIIMNLRIYISKLCFQLIFKCLV